MGRIAQVVTGEFGLVGLNGIDFIAHNGTPYPLEVNPRYSASMELLERATGSSMFDIHARACQGELPPEPSPITKIEGKAVVFARCNFIIGDTERWSQRGEIADVPRSGTAFRKGHPICTIFGRAFDPTTCLDKLVRQATAVYRHTKIGTGRAA
jgi:predicted ATP-grasp superfamily ATP-dependent carboligase